MSQNPGTSEKLKPRIETRAVGLLLNKFGLAIIAVVLALSAWAGLTIIVIIAGLLLAAAGLSKLWSILSLKGVHCECHLTETRVFPRESVELKLRIINRKVLPLPWVQVNDEIPTGFISGDPSLVPGSRPGTEIVSRSASVLWYSSISWKIRLVGQKRGYYPLGPLTITSADIFGFYPRTLIEPVTDYLIVYPEIFSLPPLVMPSLYPLGESKVEKRIYEDPSRTIGIRDYLPGDSLRRIHWKASARHQHLQVKVCEPTTTLRVAIFLASDSFQYCGAWQEELLEYGISTAASIGNYLVEKKSQVGLWINARLADSGQPAKIFPGSGVDQLMRILESLAKVGLSFSQPFVDFFQEERQKLPLGTTIIFILAYLPDRLKETILDLNHSGYKVLVYQVGDYQDSPIPEVGWYHLHKDGDKFDIISGEN